MCVLYTQKIVFKRSLLIPANKFSSQTRRPPSPLVVVSLFERVTSTNIKGSGGSHLRFAALIFAFSSKHFKCSPTKTSKNLSMQPFLHPHSRVIWLLFVLNFKKHASLFALLKIFLSLLKRMKAMASNPKFRSNTGTCAYFRQGPINM